MFKEAINNYLHTHGYESIDLKAVLFDMDGVLVRLHAQPC